MATRDRIRRSLADLDRVEVRHRALTSRLVEARAALTTMQQDAKSGHEAMDRSAFVVRSIDAAYERAQLGATDLRRELLPGPVGPRFQLPPPSTLAEEPPEAATDDASDPYEPERAAPELAGASARAVGAAVST